MRFRFQEADEALAVGGPLQVALDAEQVCLFDPDTEQALEHVTLVGAKEGTVSVRDGLGREYAQLPAGPEVRFTVAGPSATTRPR